MDIMHKAMMEKKVLVNTCLSVGLINHLQMDSQQHMYVNCMYSFVVFLSPVNLPTAEQRVMVYM